MKRILITTADSASWVRDRPVLFLGKWCCLHDRQDDWRGLDAEIVPYHWDDREKFQRDYTYLRDVYERILALAAQSLNAAHGTSHSLRYWRILIGPWLYMFTHVLFDRWSMIERVTSIYDIDETLLIRYPGTELVPAELKNFNSDSERWNHYIFGRVIKYQNKIRWIEVDPDQPDDRTIAPEKSGIARGASSLRERLRALAERALQRLTRRDEAFIITSHLPRIEEAKLQLALGQVPKFWRTPCLERTEPNAERRQQFVVPGEGGDDFSRFVCAMLPEQIPTVYLEGYGHLAEIAADLPWPTAPKVIFTSNSFQFDEVFQAWAAAKTEIGAPLVIGQHGGFYGVGKWIVGEDHQVAISDRFLTWGWDDDRPATYPLFALTNVNKAGGTWKPDGHLLLVTVSIRVYSFKCHSMPVGPNQSEEFVSDQLRFAECLSGGIRDALIVRIHKQTDEKLKSAYVLRWTRAYPDVTLDFSAGPIEPLIRHSRLFVYTYNSTGFLETLGRNIPTIVFWNPRHWELRAGAQPYFYRLRKAGIFHETPESAAAQVEKVWDNVGAWWNRADVQEARRYFCERFVRMPDNSVRQLKDALLTAGARGCA